MLAHCATVSELLSRQLVVPSMGFSSTSFPLFSPHQFSISFPAFPSSCAVFCTGVAGSFLLTPLECLMHPSPTSWKTQLLWESWSCTYLLQEVTLIEVLLSLLSMLLQGYILNSMSSCPHGQPDPQPRAGNWSVGTKLKPIPSMHEHGPAAPGKCSSVPCVIYLLSLQIPCSPLYNEQMQMWNYLRRVNLSLE